MGNFFFRVMAQHVTSPEEVFQNVFMVGADERADEFSNEYNPDAVGDGRGNGFEISRELLQAATVEDEILPNGGYAITKITKKVHVIWNNDDDALAIREDMQLHDGGENAKKALGKYGNLAKDLMKAPYFQDRVIFHDLTEAYEEGWADLAHSYHWMEMCVNIYVGNKFQKGQSFPVKSANGETCTSADTCQSNYCSTTCTYGPPNNTSGKKWVESA